jgi:hypothetical protein
VELAGGSRIKDQTPSSYNFYKNHLVSSGGWKRVAGIEIIESRF